MTPLQYIKQNHTRFIQKLEELIRIPSVSFNGFPKNEVNRSADWVCWFRFLVSHLSTSGIFSDSCDYLRDMVIVSNNVF